jgi:hypothetical protein
MRIQKGEPCLVGINYLFILVFGSGWQVPTASKYRIGGDSSVVVLYTLT